MRVAFALDCRTEIKAPNVHQIAKILQYWCTALERLNPLASSGQTSFKVWVLFEDQCTLESLRGVVPQLITSCISPGGDSEHRTGSGDAGAEFLRNFIDWINAAPPQQTKLLLISPCISRWVASVGALQQGLAENGHYGRAVPPGVLSIDCVDVAQETAKRARFSSPLAQMFGELGISATAKQIFPLQVELVQTFRSLITFEELAFLSLKGAVSAMHVAAADSLCMQPAQRVAAGSLTRLSLREPPAARAQTSLNFDIRSRAKWRGIPQQAVSLLLAFLESV
ncbi:hypothetical protein Efla_006440 [Eimeria flavescens]